MDLKTFLNPSFSEDRGTNLPDQEVMFSAPILALSSLSACLVLRTSPYTVLS